MKKIIDLLKYDETQELETRFLTNYWKVWDFVGLWPRRDGTQTWLSRLRYFYPRSVIALAFFNMSIPCCIHLYHNSSDILVVTEVFCAIFLSLMVITKISTYIFQESKFKNIYSIIESLHDQQIVGNSYEESALRKSKFLSRIMNKFIAPFLTISVALCCVPIVGVLFVKRIIPFQAWYPCKDKKASPCFELILSYQVVVVSTLLHIIMISDVILIDLLTNTLAQFNVLCHNLESIREHSESKIKIESESRIMNTFGNYMWEEVEIIPTESGIERAATVCPRREHLRSGIDRCARGARNERELFTLSKSVEMCHEPCISGKKMSRVVMNAIGKESQSTLQVRSGNEGIRYNNRDGNYSSHFVVNISKSANERRTRANRSQLFASGISSLETQNANAAMVWRRKAQLNEERQLKLDRTMKRRIGECVSHHQILLSLVSEIESVYQPYFVIQLICNVLPISICLYYFLMIPALRIQDAILVLSMIFTIGELLIFCFLADQITDMSSRVKDSIYACDWLGASESYKRSMRIIISRSNNPFVFRVMKFLTLSLPLYAEVTHLAYKQFTVMKSVGEK